MKKTIQVALSPLLIVGAFCGLAFFECPLGRPRPYLTCLYLLITWSFYMYLCYYILIYTNYTVMYTYMLSWTNIIIMFCGIVSMFVNLYRFKQLKTCLYKLSFVDDTLEVLGTSKEYQQLYKWTIKITIGWILSTFLVNTCDSIWINYDYFSFRNICIPIVANLMFHINGLNSLIWGYILKYINSKFHQINGCILDLVKDDVICSIRRRNKLILDRQQSAKEQRKSRQYMWIIMHVHLELTFISRELNKVFSIQMTLQMASYFAFFVELCCDVYTEYIDKETDKLEHFLNNLFTYIWAVIYTTKFLTLNHICQMISDKAKETITILYKLSNDISDKDLQEQILQFILQIKRREVKFYGMGLFYFGYNFIRKFYATIATVLVIVIQMHITYYDLSPYDGTIHES